MSGDGVEGFVSVESAGAMISFSSSSAEKSMAAKSGSIVDDRPDAADAAAAAVDLIGRSLPLA